MLTRVPHSVIAAPGGTRHRNGVAGAATPPAGVGQQPMGSSKPPLSMSIAGWISPDVKDLQVETAAEYPMVSGDHDGAGIVAVGVVERIVEGLLHRRAEKRDFAVAHRDERDGIIEAIN